MLSGWPFNYSKHFYGHFILLFGFVLIVFMNSGLFLYFPQYLAIAFWSFQSSTFIICLLIIVEGLFCQFRLKCFLLITKLNVHN